MPRPAKPTREQLLAAKNKKSVPDIVGPGMRVLLVGINPGLYSGATGHHFARPGNRFWPALHLSGFTPRQLHPSEERELLAYGVGMTKLVHRATATAAELTREEYRRGGGRVRAMVRKWRPRGVCFLGVGAYGAAYGVKRVMVGRQAQDLGGAMLWVIPNPSGLNANYQLPDFVRMLREVGDAVEEADGTQTRRMKT